MPAPVPIPGWNAEGLLPPVDPANPASLNRSPYPASLTEFVTRFNTSPERMAILSGFLDYRAALHAAGLTGGFQWLNGSFVEHIEEGHRKRPPRDIDVVTFFQLPSGVSLADLVARVPDLFPADAAGLQALKARFKVDAYTIHLAQNAERLVDRSAYWYGMWAHQRDTMTWKGFLQIDLAPVDDATARGLIGTGATTP